MHDVLVIVPCGSSKIWSKHPDCGPTAAADAYIGTPFKLNREYAERFGAAWVVLSAKYGFVLPEFEIPESYEVTFKRPSTHPVTIEVLERQVVEMHLDRYPVVVGLGGFAYREAISAAFTSRAVQLAFPFAGLPLGKMMQATRNAIRNRDAGFSDDEKI
jgi:hypothetical protein